MRNHDAEHGFAALETDVLRRYFKGLSAAEIAVKIDPALHAFNRRRKELLKLYPAVEPTLSALRERGVVILAHSEAKFHSVVDRLSRLNLWSHFDAVYCRERSPSSHPFPERADHPASEADLGKVRELSHHQRKPSAEVLSEICIREGAKPEASAFVGDSMAKDVVMAKAAGVLAIWARYGTDVDPVEYERLVRVSHWTSSEIAREIELRRQAEGVSPDAVLNTGFSEILRFIEATAAA